MNNLSPKSCLQCGKSLIGRADKRFCDAYCRNTFNNQRKSKEELKIQATNSAMRKNRTILKTLCPTGKATVRKEILTQMGFSFRHFTSAYGKTPNLYFLCYDYAYRPIKERSQSTGEIVQKVLIVQQQDYMKAFDPWKMNETP